MNGWSSIYNPSKRFVPSNTIIYIIGVYHERKYGMGDFVKFDNWIFNKMNFYSFIE